MMSAASFWPNSCVSLSAYSCCPHLQELIRHAHVDGAAAVAAKPAAKQAVAA